VACTSRPGSSTLHQFTQVAPWQGSTKGSSVDNAVFSHRRPVREIAHSLTAAASALNDENDLGSRPRPRPWQMKPPSRYLGTRVNVCAASSGRVSVAIQSRQYRILNAKALAQFCDEHLHTLQLVRKPRSHQTDILEQDVTLHADSHQASERVPGTYDRDLHSLAHIRPHHHTHTARHARTHRKTGHIITREGILGLRVN